MDSVDGVNGAAVLNAAELDDSRVMAIAQDQLSLAKELSIIIPVEEGCTILDQLHQGFLDRKSVGTSTEIASMRTVLNLVKHPNVAVAKKANQLAALWFSLASKFFNDRCQATQATLPLPATAPQAEAGPSTPAPNKAKEAEKTSPPSKEKTPEKSVSKAAVPPPSKRVKIPYRKVPAPTNRKAKKLTKPSPPKKASPKTAGAAKSKNRGQKRKKKAEKGDKPIKKRYEQAYLVSRRGEVTQEQRNVAKNNAEDLVKTLSEEKAMSIVLTKGNVYNHWFLPVRKPLRERGIFPESGEIWLQDMEGGQTQVMIAGNGLSGGWKNVVVKLGLEEGDVVVFEAAEGENPDHRYKLHVFRVVEPAPGRDSYPFWSKARRQVKEEFQENPNEV